MKKFRIFLSLKKEEEWINSIQEEGYRLVSVSSVVPIYTFEKLASKETFIPYVRLDFREKSMGKVKYEDYVTLFSDSGWKLIKGSRSGGAQYFQQEYPDVTRDIFSDTDSQESVKKRYVKYGYTYGTLVFLSFFIFFSSNSWNLDTRLNFKSWSFTHCVCEMEGMWFWKAFIFETPFVLLRVLPLFFFLFLCIYYILRSLINDDSTVITK